MGLTRSVHIQVLEGKIKALEKASSKYIEEKNELRHEIEILKEKIKTEKEDQDKTKNTLETRNNKLTQKNRISTN